MRKTETINLSDEDLFVAVFGSGAGRYEWYSYFDYDEDALEGTVHIDCEGIVGGEQVITPLMLRGAVDEMLDARYRFGRIDFNDPECDSDFDANMADVILQWLVFGRVVFG